MLSTLLGDHVFYSTVLFDLLMIIPSLIFPFIPPQNEGGSRPGVAPTRPLRTAKPKFKGSNEISRGPKF